MYQSVVHANRAVARHQELLAAAAERRASRPARSSRRHAAVQPSTRRRWRWATTRPIQSHS
jgi:hypothetical protein